MPEWPWLKHQEAELDPTKVLKLGIREELASNRIFRLTDILTTFMTLPATIEPFETTIWPSSNHPTMAKLLVGAVSPDWQYESGEKLTIESDQLDRLELAMFLMAFAGWDAEIVDANGSQFFRSHDEFWEVELKDGDYSQLIEMLQKSKFAIWDESETASSGST